MMDCAIMMQKELGALQRIFSPSDMDKKPYFFYAHAHTTIQRVTKLNIEQFGI